MGGLDWGCCGIALPNVPVAAACNIVGMLEKAWTGKDLPTAPINLEVIDCFSPSPVISTTSRGSTDVALPGMDGGAGGWAGISPPGRLGASVYSDLVNVPSDLVPSVNAVKSDWLNTNPPVWLRGVLRARENLEDRRRVCCAGEGGPEGGVTLGSYGFDRASNSARVREV